MPLDGRVALITGATGSLGRVAARAFADAGARLALAGTDEARLSALASELGLSGERWIAAAADLRSPTDTRRAVATVEERLGAIDVLLHLVGGWVGGTAVVDLDRDELGSMLDQHLWTTLNVVQAVVPGMLARGWGRVLVVSSPVALSPGPRGASYAIAKAAEETLVRSLAREVGASGVTANVVAVRTIDARHERESAPAAANAAWTTPEEVVQTLLFLASDEAAAANGIRVPLDGRG